ncbi:MAG: hypothetical protein R3B46_09900 [Phycisphaerales bacterium]
MSMKPPPPMPQDSGRTTESETGRDGGVDGVASAQGIGSGPGCEGMIGGDGAWRRLRDNILPRQAALLEAERPIVFTTRLKAARCDNDGDGGEQPLNKFVFHGRLRWLADGYSISP